MSQGSGVSALRSCPWCQTTALHLDAFGQTNDEPIRATEWRVMHNDGLTPACDAWGPECDTRDEAIAAWNNRAVLHGA